MSRVLLAFLVFASLLITPIAAQAADDMQDRASARAIGKRAFQAYENENYEKAVDLFNKAEELHHATTHLLYLARAHQKLGHPVEAFELYRQIIHEQLDDKAPQAFRDAQESAQEEVGAAESQIAHVVIEVTGPGAQEARLFVGDRELSSALIGVPAPVNPGPQVFRAETETARSESVEETMTSGQEVTVHLKLTLQASEPGKDGTSPDEEASARRSKVPAFVAMGVGVAGVAVGAVFTAQHFGKKGDADDLFDERGCASGCSTEDQNDVKDLDQKAKTAGTISWIGYGVGVAGIGTGIALLLIGPPKVEAQVGQSSVRPYFGWGTAGLTGTF